MMIDIKYSVKVSHRYDNENDKKNAVIGWFLREAYITNFRLILWTF